MKTLKDQINDQVRKAELILKKYEDNKDPKQSEKLGKAALKAVNNLAAYIGVTAREKSYNYSRYFFDDMCLVIRRYVTETERIRRYANFKY